MKKSVVIILLLASVYGVFGMDQKIEIDQLSEGFWCTKISYSRTIVSPIWAGIFFHVPTLMYIQGDFNTGAAGFSIQTRFLLKERFFAGARVETGYKYQGQSLGVVHSLFADFLLQFGLCVRRFKFGFQAGIDQTMFLHIDYSDFAASAFSKADYSCTVFFPASRYRLGMVLGNVSLQGLGFSVSGGWLFAPSPFVKGFEGMMFGRFPFYACLALEYKF